MPTSKKEIASSSIDISTKEIAKLSDKDLDAVAKSAHDNLTKQISKLTPEKQEALVQKLSDYNTKKINALLEQKNLNAAKEKELKNALIRSLMVVNYADKSTKIKVLTKGELYKNSFSDKSLSDLKTLEANKLKNNIKKDAPDNSSDKKDSESLIPSDTNPKKGIPDSSKVAPEHNPDGEKNGVEKNLTQEQFDKKVQDEIKKRMKDMEDFLKKPSMNVDMTAFAQSPTVQAAQQYVQYLAGDKDVTNRWQEMGMKDLPLSGMGDVRDFYKNQFGILEKSQFIEGWRTGLDIATGVLAAGSIATNIFDKSNKSTFDKIASGWNGKNYEPGKGLVGGEVLGSVMQVFAVAMMNPGMGQEKNDGRLSPNDIQLLAAAQSLHGAGDKNEMLVFDLIRYLHKDATGSVKLTADGSKIHVKLYEQYLEAKQKGDTVAATAAADGLAQKFKISLLPIPSIGTKETFVPEKDEDSKISQAMNTMSLDGKSALKNDMSAYKTTLEGLKKTEKDPTKLAVIDSELKKFEALSAQQEGSQNKMTSSMDIPTDNADAKALATRITDAQKKYADVVNQIKAYQKDIDTLYDEKNTDYTAKIMKQNKIASLVQFTKRFNVKTMIDQYNNRYGAKPKDHNDKGTYVYLNTQCDDMENEFNKLSKETKVTNLRDANNSPDDLKNRLRNLIYLHVQNPQKILEESSSKNALDPASYVEHLIDSKMEQLKGFPELLVKLDDKFKKLAKGQSHGFTFETFLKEKVEQIKNVDTEAGIQKLLDVYTRAFHKAKLYEKVLDGVERNANNGNKKLDPTDELQLPTILEKMGVKNPKNPEKHANAFSFMRLVKEDMLTADFKKFYMTSPNLTLDDNEGAGMLNSLSLMLGDISDHRAGKTEYKNDKTLAGAMLAALQNPSNLDYLGKQKSPDQKAKEVEFAKMFSKEELFDGFMDGAKKVNVDTKTVNMGLQFDWDKKNISGGWIGSKDVYKIVLKKVMGNEIVSFDCYLREQCMNIQMSPKNTITKDKLDTFIPTFETPGSIDTALKFPDFSLKSEIQKEDIAAGNVDAEVMRNTWALPVGALLESGSYFVPGSPFTLKPVDIRGTATFTGPTLPPTHNCVPGSPECPVPPQVPPTTGNTPSTPGGNGGGGGPHNPPSFTPESKVLSGNALLQLKDTSVKTLSQEQIQNLTIADVNSWAENTLRVSGWKMEQNFTNQVKDKMVRQLLDAKQLINDNKDKPSYVDSFKTIMSNMFDTKTQNDIAKTFASNVIVSPNMGNKVTPVVEVVTQKK